MDGLVVVNGGMLGILNALRTTWLPSLFIGLFQNDWVPQKWHTIADVQPATFSGYSGLHFLDGWSVPYMLGDIAVSDATPREWLHDGGPDSNWIFGYYVVDSSGALQWAQRVGEFAVAMFSVETRYTVTPQFAQGSRYPS